jgi:hypothetical protein
MTPEIAQTFFEQIFELWINPEIERRQKTTPESVPPALIAAQIVFSVDRPHQVRLNNEIKAEAALLIDESGLIKGVEHIKLIEEDANSAHITLVKTGPEHWALSFRAHYNLARARTLFGNASNYLDVAKYALSKGFVGCFVDNLYSAVELAAKSRLMLMPDPKILTAKTHRYIVSEFNMFAGQLGNAPESHCEVLNSLAAKRNGPNT